MNVFCEKCKNNCVLETFEYIFPYKPTGKEGDKVITIDDCLKENRFGCKKCKRSKEKIVEDSKVLLGRELDKKIEESDKNLERIYSFMEKTEKKFFAFKDRVQEEKNKLTDSETDKQIFSRLDELLLKEALEVKGKMKHLEEMKKGTFDLKNSLIEKKEEELNKIGVE